MADDQIGKWFARQSDFWRFVTTIISVIVAVVSVGVSWGVMNARVDGLTAQVQHVQRGGTELSIGLREQVALLRQEVHEQRGEIREIYKMLRENRIVAPQQLVWRKEN